uniref:Uncharacterized protein n=1 Tax=Chromera velia CCMP2878 TaxID=1169474 RepID=A0A0G4IDR1_9ALVE|eukprot:Cvel_2344.t1-p1 / transcript=Cvel_2344.t1 / gene=Cvel_2344 / organism=Chromera_velia_CCMP2878 / gene_product=hypothetical protein / transcript_product=hypothetical protein / location=Cvel_scaffold91:4048-6373(-) / protein_length=446 / sequence_SO=supercontig / SO=protein_coding / is_pseudo=false
MPTALQFYQVLSRRSLENAKRNQRIRSRALLRLALTHVVFPSPPPAATTAASCLLSVLNKNAGSVLLRCQIVALLEDSMSLVSPFEILEEAERLLSLWRVHLSGSVDEEEGASFREEGGQHSKAVQRGLPKLLEFLGERYSSSSSFSVLHGDSPVPRHVAPVSAVLSRTMCLCLKGIQAPTTECLCAVLIPALFDAVQRVSFQLHLRRQAESERDPESFFLQQVGREWRGDERFSEFCKSIDLKLPQELQYSADRKETCFLAPRRQIQKPQPKASLSVIGASGSSLPSTVPLFSWSPPGPTTRGRLEERRRRKKPPESFKLIQTGAKQQEKGGDRHQHHSQYSAPYHSHGQPGWVSTVGCPLPGMQLMQPCPAQQSYLYPHVAYGFSHIPYPYVSTHPTHQHANAVTVPQAACPPPGVPTHLGGNSVPQGEKIVRIGGIRGFDDDN